MEDGPLLFLFFLVDFTFSSLHVLVTRIHLVVTLASLWLVSRL